MLQLCSLSEPIQDFTGSVYIRTNVNVSTGRATTAPEADHSGGTPVPIIAAAIFGGIIGVLLTAVVCVCVWCIARYVRIQARNNIENQNSNPSKQHHKQQEQEQEEDGLTNVISMQQNEAYKQIPYSMEPTVYETVTEIPEPAVQSNLAYGRQSETCEGIDTEETGDEYERMYAANRHVMFVRGPERCFNSAKPREYELPVRQQESNTYVHIEDNEQPYDYIL